MSPLEKVALCFLIGAVIAFIVNELFWKGK